jgi:hypothetical protein
MLEVSLVTVDMKVLLNSFGHLSYQSPGLKPKHITFEAAVGHIDFTIAEEPKHTFFECSWFCPLLFSVFSRNDLSYLLSACLLEKTLVFVSDNPTLLSHVM